MGSGIGPLDIAVTAPIGVTVKGDLRPCVEVDVRITERLT